MLSTVEGTLYVEGHELIHLLDVPHLGKCKRNLLSTYDLDPYYTDCKKTSEEEIINWDPVRTGYIIDDFGPFSERLFPKWTPQHIFPGRMKKMPVKKALQLFSKKAGEGILKLATIKEPVQTSFRPKVMPPNSEAVGRHIIFMDKVIDSINGAAPRDAPNENRLPVMEKSFHHDFWTVAKTRIARMRFVKKQNKDGVRHVVTG
ncbi:hypothetical protein QAD02_020138 [Eretmocerus hayati]|uniref:Uncharacterized protein n=1 Tax=Eretmocerus hayati TaxID=131215 RepID=A0ACC2PMT9_9HYME|nr:hypothetical protein QAD02_020138 [Eretmocerus hayati]